MTPRLLDVATDTGQSRDEKERYGVTIRCGGVRFPSEMYTELLPISEEVIQNPISTLLP